MNKLLSKWKYHGKNHCPIFKKEQEFFLEKKFNPSSPLFSTFLFSTSLAYAKLKYLKSNVNEHIVNKLLLKWKYLKNIT